MKHIVALLQLALKYKSPDMYMQLKTIVISDHPETISKWTQIY